MGKMLREVKWDNKFKWRFKRVNRTFQTGVGYHTDLSMSPLTQTTEM